MVFVGRLRERDNLEDLGRDGKIILKWVLKSCDGGGVGGMDWTDLLRIGAGACECGNEPSGYHKMQGVCWLRTC